MNRRVNVSVLTVISFLVLGMLGVKQVRAETETSALVSTVMLKQQAIHASVTAYGVAMSDVHSAQNVSMPRAGRVLRFLINPGQSVKRGTPLFEFETDPEASVSYTQANHEVEYWTKEVQRQTQMLQQQLSTQSQLDNAKRELSNAQANQIAQTKIGNKPGTETVRAERDGWVAAIQIAQGDRLSSGATILQLTLAGKQRITVGVEPSHASQIHAGQDVKLSVLMRQALNISGRVVHVGGLINPQSQLIDVVVETTQAGLLPGARIRAEIQLDAIESWVVPRSSVLSDDQGLFVFQVVGNKAKRVEVSSGVEQGNLIAVKGELDAKAPVVSVGNYELEDGMAVRGDSR